jgi:hypothetical protein
VKTIAAFAVVLIIVSAGSAFAQSRSDQPEMGTPEQRSACGPDVGRFCKKVKPEDGPMGYLACLQDHRAQLRKACQDMLTGVGQ